MISITIQINCPIQTVWELWTQPNHIARWNNPDENWHTPSVEINLKEGGAFLYKMETKDGLQGFDHTGIYEKVIPLHRIEYTLVDGRKSIIVFTHAAAATQLTEQFDPEPETPIELQKQFCTQILEGFKKYAESNCT